MRNTLGSWISLSIYSELVFFAAAPNDQMKRAITAILPCQGSPQPIQTAAFNLSLDKYPQIRYFSVKVLLTVSPLRPSFSPQPCVYPHRSTPRFALSTTHHPLPTFPRRSHARTLSGFSYNYELPLLPHRFARPLFSYNYELLFSQPLCFDKHLRCPIVFSVA